MELILASASQRRQELMRMCGYEFEVIPSRAEEDIACGDPGELVERLSLVKARSVFAELPDDRRKNAVVVGSDTVVVLDGLVLGKPKSREDAFRMLREESGRENVVYTGIAVVCADGISVTHDEARVRFAELDDSEIEDYIASGDPMDKAGAYGIQGVGATLVRRINGDFYNVMGLPVARLKEELFNERIISR